MGSGANVSASTSPSGGQLGAWIRLGRVSNLPTVWTNVLAAAALTGEVMEPVAVLLLLLAMSMSYVAGMILNDAFDATHDAVHRPYRPIPSGAVSRAAAFRVGAVGLVLPVFGVGLIAHQLGQPAFSAALSGLALAATIVAYDAHHKLNPFGPVMMGACRALVYLSSALVLSGRLSDVVVAAALLQWSYVLGLTYAAKQEDLVAPRSFWPVMFLLAPPLVVTAGLLAGVPEPFAGERSSWMLAIALVFFLCSLGYGMAPLLGSERRIGAAVGRLIAGVAVLDAVFLAAAGWTEGIGLAIAAAFLTHVAQRFVPGT